MDLIDRQAAIDALNGSLVVDGKENAERVMKYLKGISAKIKALPPVQPERKKGTWIDHTDDGYVECPFCGSATNCDGDISELHYCFSCGADLKGGEKHDD